MLVLTMPGPFLTAASSFLPSDLPNLLTWWKADAITPQADGTGVQTWPDSSGNGWHLTQATSLRRPLYRTAGPNSLPYVEFAGASNVHMASASMAGVAPGPPWTMFWVVYINQTFASGPRLWENDYTADATQDARVRLTAGSLGSFVGASTSGPEVSNAGLVLPFVWRTFTFRMSTAATAHAYTNNEARDTSPNNMTLFTPGVQVVGASSTAGGNAAKINLAEQIIFSAELSDADELQVNTYLNDKYGGLY